MVDGTAIPDVDYDVGESYAGLMPLGNSTEDEFYFWFFPSTNPAADGEILIWLNGGVSLIYQLDAQPNCPPSPPGAPLEQFPPFS